MKKRYGILAGFLASVLTIATPVAALADTGEAPQSGNAQVQGADAKQTEGAVSQTNADGANTAASSANADLVTGNPAAQGSEAGETTDAASTTDASENGYTTVSVPAKNAGEDVQAPADGWNQDGDTWYFAENGQYVRSAWRKINGNWYWFDSNGKMATGWVNVSGKWYYLTKGGAMATGWIDDGGHRYFADASGVMATGWREINGPWYYFNGSGVMQKGWVKDGGSWYHLDQNGARQTGWIKVNGVDYYLKSDGKMAANEYINGYWLDPDGAWRYKAVAQWYQNGRGRYYQDNAGWYAKNETLKIDGKSYTFGPSGYLGDGMDEKAQGYTSPTSYLILVNNTSCVVRVYQGSQGNWTKIKEIVCGPGAASTPTIRGTYHVGGKFLSFGHGYTCWYATQIYGDYLFHSVLYKQGSKSVIIDNTLGRPVSHGCVRMAIDNAKWIYDNIPSGTTVVSY